MIDAIHKAKKKHISRKTTKEVFGRQIISHVPKMAAQQTADFIKTIRKETKLSHTNP